VKQCSETSRNSGSEGVEGEKEEEEAPHVKGESISLGMHDPEKGKDEELARQWLADVQTFCGSYGRA